MSEKTDSGSRQGRPHPKHEAAIEQSERLGDRENMSQGRECSLVPPHPAPGNDVIPDGIDGKKPPSDDFKPRPSVHASALSVAAGQESFGGRRYFGFVSKEFRMVCPDILERVVGIAWMAFFRQADDPMRLVP